MDIKHAASIWKPMISPSDIYIENTSNVLFATNLGIVKILMHDNLWWIVGKRGKGSTMHYAMIVASTGSF